MICNDLLAPPAEGEHRPAGEEAAAAEGKDAADDKMEGKWSRHVQ